VELDESLGGGPVQYREVSGSESSLFASYFKDTGIEYLPGGVDSGFVHVDRDAFETRLLQVKGKRTVRVTTVATSNASLNTGDCFILDTGRALYVYNGESANRYEKAKCVETVAKIRDSERGGNATITIVNEEPDCAAFWEALGGKIAVTNAGEDDAAAERKAAAATKLFQISDASGSVEMNLVGEGKLDRATLSTNDTFLVDSGNDITVWVGKGSSPDEKKEGMLRAMKYIADNGLPANTAISRVVEGAETPLFKQLFAEWTPPRKFDFSRQSSTGVAAAAEQKDIDFAALHTRMEQQEASVDDGSGKVDVWRIEDMAKVAVDKSMHGQFFGGDSYIVLYTYQKDGTEEYIIYFWQGRDSSQDEKGASALLAKELDDQLGDRPVQVRVVQGKEPAHFRAIFGGTMIVRAGGKASGFKNREDNDSYDVDGTELYHVKGTNATNTYGVAVAESASSLNSGDCFVLLTPGKTTIWQGSGANDAEKETAAKIAEVIKVGAVSTVTEGGEDDDFWGAIGGKGDYPKSRPGEPEPADPRLFQCTNVTGAFAIEEISNFSQEDLIDDDVMLLDCYSSVFLWVGSAANATEKKDAIKSAQQYVSTSNDGRDPDTPIMVIKAGRENSLFTQHFLGWDSEMHNKNKFTDPYASKLADMKASQKEVEEEEDDEPLVITASSAAPGEIAAGTTFPLEKLRRGSVTGVPHNKKEDFLSDEEFQAAFGMDKAKFGALPQWKKNEAKKKAGLF
jgi:hypothetical protein